MNHDTDITFHNARGSDFQKDKTESTTNDRTMNGNIYGTT